MWQLDFCELSNLLVQTQLQKEVLNGLMVDVSVKLGFSWFVGVFFFFFSLLSNLNFGLSSASNSFL